ncbi:hypothetical protein GC176_18155 [bacterium]|nr:hypothetical protein [bacterium]
MRLDGAIFAIEQRSVGGCIDLAAVFLREHFAGILRLLACFAVPSVLLTWWLIAELEWTTSTCLFLFALESPFCGAALVAAAGHRVFGERFSTRTGLRLVLRRLPVLLFLLTTARLLTCAGMFLLLLPGYVIATRYGFLSEILLLELCPLRKYETRLNDLLNGTFWSLLGRLIMILVFFSTTVVSLFLFVDLLCGTLFSWPILSGRISSLAYVDRELATLLTVDPRVGTVLVAVLWFVYPIARLAWMFCYLDVRILKEGWDIELDFRIEARRLQEQLEATL